MKCAVGEVTSSYSCAEQAGTRGLLPLWLLCMLHGGPLMPCLRLLLCNDCLFDITARRQLYNSVLQLITHMAGELLRLLWTQGAGGTETCGEALSTHAPWQIPCLYRCLSQLDDCAAQGVTGRSQILLYSASLLLSRV